MDECCPNCGVKLKKEAQFCPNCGVKLKTSKRKYLILIFVVAVILGGV